MNWAIPIIIVGITSVYLVARLYHTPSVETFVAANQIDLYRRVIQLLNRNQVEWSVICGKGLTAIAIYSPISRNIQWGSYGILFDGSTFADTYHRSLFINIYMASGTDLVHGTQRIPQSLPLVDCLVVEIPGKCPASCANHPLELDAEPVVRQSYPFYGTSTYWPYWPMFVDHKWRRRNWRNVPHGGGGGPPRMYGGGHGGGHGGGPPPPAAAAAAHGGVEFAGGRSARTSVGPTITRMGPGRGGR